MSDSFFKRHSVQLTRRITAAFGICNRNLSEDEYLGILIILDFALFMFDK